MKTRTDFVTNSSSSSFTIINFDSLLIEEWMKKHPISYSSDSFSGEEAEYSTFNELLEIVANSIDADGNGVELIEDKGIVDNLVYILGGGGAEQEDEGEEPDKNLLPLISFLKKNRKKIEAEGRGEILCAIQFEDDAPTIDAVRHENGKSKHVFLDFDEIDAEETDVQEMYELGGCTPEILHETLKKYASCGGLKFAITGKLNTFENRDELIEFIEKRGGSVGSGVTAKTDYLINNDINSISSKNRKAVQLGVSIITETQFIEMFCNETEQSEEAMADNSESKNMFKPTDEIAPIRTHTDIDPHRGNTIVAEMTLANNGLSVFVLEYYYDAMENVQFSATTESVWSFFTENSISEKEKNKFWKNFKKIKIEHIDEIFADVVTYKGNYKTQLQALHETLLKVAEEKGVHVEFKWVFK